MAIRSFGEFTPQIAPSAYVDIQAAVIGKVTLAADCSVWPMAVVRGDVEQIYVGAKTNIQDNAVLHVTHDGPYTPGGCPLHIGCSVTIGHSATLHACTIGDFCLIGMGAIVLDEAKLPPFTMLAAGTLVPPNKQLEGGFLYKGNPATQARALTAAEREFLAYSAEHYVRLKEKHQK